MQADGIVDLLMNFAASLNVMRGEPAPYALGLQIRIEAVCELLILGLSCLSWKWRKRSSVKIDEFRFELGTLSLSSTSATSVQHSL